MTIGSGNLNLLYQTQGSQGRLRTGDWRHKLLFLKPVGVTKRAGLRLLHIESSLLESLILYTSTGAQISPACPLGLLNKETRSQHKSHHLGLLLVTLDAFPVCSHPTPPSTRQSCQEKKRDTFHLLLSLTSPPPGRCVSV